MPGRLPGGPGRSSFVCIIRDVPACEQPSKISGVLTCPLAPLLPLLTACWPAHSLQLHSKHLVLFSQNKHLGPKKVACAHFLFAFGYRSMPGPRSREGWGTSMQVRGWEGRPPGSGSACKISFGSTLFVVQISMEAEGGEGGRNKHTPVVAHPTGTPRN